MSIDVIQDLECYFEDWGVDITLHPGQPEERLIEKGGVFNRPSELMDMGGHLEHVVMPTTIYLRSSDAEGLEQDDLITVHPLPEQGVIGGEFKIATVLPGNAGLTKLELMEA